MKGDVGGMSGGEDLLLQTRDFLYQEVEKQDPRSPIPVQPSRKPRRIYKPPSKRVGFTKIRMEDCFRCDACSCIYIEAEDYYKHMRNFHQKYNTVIPRMRNRSPMSHKCCGTCIGTHCQSAREESKPNNPLPPTSNTNIRDKIKLRWSKVSERLSQEVTVKSEPMDDDVSYFLAQVEVKIKSEPKDPWLDSTD